MPTIHGLELPLPKHWQEFEGMTLDALAQRWRSPGLQKIGRTGQKQHGVDIWGPDDIGRPVGIQCKRYKSPLKLTTVTDEIAKAEKFVGNLTTLYVATTADYDAKLQQSVRVLSDKRVAQGKFAVSLLFWEDIVNGLLLNPAVFSSHFPQIVLPQTAATDTDDKIAALELGFYGANLWQYVVLIFGEMGWMAQADPDELIANVRIVERRAAQLLPPEDATPILKSCRYVRVKSVKRKKKESDWDPIELHAKRVDKRARGAVSLLPQTTARLLELGATLSHLYFNVDDWPQADRQADIERRVRAVLPASAGEAIGAKFADASTLRATYQWVPRIYSFVDREIRWG